MGALKRKTEKNAEPEMGEINAFHQMEPQGAQQNFFTYHLWFFDESY